MSRQQDEVRYKGNGRNQNKRSNGGATMFVSFHPTKSEKDAIKALIAEGISLDDVVEALVDRGLTVKFTQNNGGNAYCAVVAEAGKPFNEGTALACFHANVGVLIGMVHYMLTVKWTGYPEQPPTATNLEFDW